MLPSYQAAPILAECGLPSGRTVPRKEAASASAPAASRSRARFHGSGSVSDVLSRLVVAVGSRLVMSRRPHRDGELIGGAPGRAPGRRAQGRERRKAAARVGLTGLGALETSAPERSGDGPAKRVRS